MIVKEKVVEELIVEGILVERSTNEKTVVKGSAAADRSNLKLFNW